MSSNNERTVLNDRYEIQQRIGRGGMADVFLARDLLLEAIEVFPELDASRDLAHAVGMLRTVDA